MRRRPHHPRVGCDPSGDRMEDAPATPLAERSRARSRLWRFSRNRLVLYRLVVNLRNGGGGRRFVRRDSDVVIDGFERSANTFAYFAFMAANPTAHRVGHHTHSPAQFYWAARWGVPALLLLRERTCVGPHAHSPRSWMTMPAFTSRSPGGVARSSLPRSSR